MATKVSVATGLWSAAGTWKSGVAIGVSEQLIGTFFTTVGTVDSAAAASPAFSGDGTTVVHGIILRLNSVLSSPGTSTITVKFMNGASAITNGTKILEIQDLPLSGYFYVKFDTAFTLPSGTNNITVRVFTSAANLVSLVTAATGGSNWNRVIVSNAASSAPTTDEKVFVIGHYIGGETTNRPTNQFVVTMDNNSATQIGELNICVGGTLRYKVDSNTRLVVRGNVNVWDGGLFCQGGMDIGDNNNPIQSGITAILDIDCHNGTAFVNYLFGVTIQNGGKWKVRGATVAVTQAKLNADVAVGASSIVSDVATGWAQGDIIAVGATNHPTSTSQAAESEARKVGTGGASGTTIPLDAATLTQYSHLGSNSTKAALIHLTRNVKIRANSAAAEPLVPTLNTGATWFNFKPTAQIEIEYAQIHDFGGTTTFQRGLEVETTSGLCTMRYNAIYNAFNNGVYTIGSGFNNFTFVGNACFNFIALNATGSGFIISASTSGTNIVITDNVFMQRAQAQANVNLNDIGITFDNNRIIGGYYGLTVGEGAYVEGKVFDNNEINSTNFSSIIFNANTGGLTIKNSKLWHCGNNGTGSRSIFFAMTNGGFLADIVFDTCEVFGSEYLIYIYNAPYATKIVGLEFVDCQFHGTPARACNSVLFNNSTRTIFERVKFIGCELGGPSTPPPGKSGVSNHFNFAVNGFNCSIDMLLEDTNMQGGNEFTNLATILSPTSSIRIQRNDKTNALHRTEYKYGTLSLDNATTPRSGGSTPTEQVSIGNNGGAGKKVRSGVKRVALLSGQQVTPKVWVTRSAGYNGTKRPRLVMKRNHAAGVLADVEVAEMSTGTDWEQLNSGGTLYPSTPVIDDCVLEFVVDGEGTAGTFNVDDWSF